ncbi:hypothetical protein FQA39_LY01801 [Lamprigera yunnana]|nr:hypothetical protein FQA39_LY01801 [Lamprigera yunnana]
MKGLDGAINEKNAKNGSREEQVDERNIGLTDPKGERFLNGYNNGDKKAETKDTATLQEIRWRVKDRIDEKEFTIIDSGAEKTRHATRAKIRLEETNEHVSTEHICTYENPY